MLIFELCESRKAFEVKTSLQPTMKHLSSLGVVVLAAVVMGDDRDRLDDDDDDVVDVDVGEIEEDNEVDDVGMRRLLLFDLNFFTLLAAVLFSRFRGFIRLLLDKSSSSR